MKNVIKIKELGYNKDHLFVGCDDQQCSACLLKSWEEQNKEVRFFELLVNRSGIILCENCASKLRDIIDCAIETNNR